MDQSCPHLTNANLTKDLQGKLIYKDECTRCFDTAVLFLYLHILRKPSMESMYVWNASMGAVADQKWIIHSYISICRSIRSLLTSKWYLKRKSTQISLLK